MLLLATRSAGKLRELRRMTASSGWHWGGLDEFPGIPEAVEHGRTFLENARIKALYYAQLTSLPALADDSGLCVLALGGAPGVHSARFAGEPKSDLRNNELLLSRLAGEQDRRAYFYCMAVLMRHPEDPRPLVADGEWHGEILEAPRGENGFGYDPLFYLPDLEQTAAELDAALKNTLSHRGAAMRHMLDRLRVHPLE